DNGEHISNEDIPANLKDDAAKYRDKLLDAASMFDDELAEKYLEGADIPVDMLKRAIRKGCLAMAMTPVFCGSAYKNRGVQKLLDGVTDYLPNPTEIENKALDIDKDETPVVLTCDPNKPL